MSGYVKGTRKPKRGLVIKDIEIGGIKIKPAVAIVALLAALYVVFLIGAKLESGIDALILSVFSFAVFAALAYIVRSGSLAGLKPFTLLIDAFLALSTLSLAQAFAGLVNIFGPDMSLTPQRLAFMMSVSAAMAAIVLAATLFLENADRKSIYLKAAPLKTAIMGFIALAACGLIALYLLYIIVDGKDFILTALNILVFGLLGGVYEEALFRGLLLSRLMLVLGKKHALVIQAVIFAVFEVLALNMLIPHVFLLPVVFIAAALIGYYLGTITIKNESILAPQLIHAGLLLLAIPLLIVLPMLIVW